MRGTRERAVVRAVRGPHLPREGGEALALNVRVEDDVAVAHVEVAVALLVDEYGVQALDAPDEETRLLADAVRPLLDVGLEAARLF